MRSSGDDVVACANAGKQLIAAGPALTGTAEDTTQGDRPAATVKVRPPERIQRKRTKGWKMPGNTVYVGRPTKWGNPFVVGKRGGAFTALVKDQRHAWQLYRSIAIDNEKLIAAAREDLAGKNLACFCPKPTQLYEPDCCHAAVLLELANGPALSQAQRVVDK